MDWRIRSGLLKDDKNLQVCYALAQKPMTIYDLGKTFENLKKTIPHSTIYSIIKELEKCEVIEVKKEEQFRTGLKKKEYGLTSKGFQSLIYEFPQRIEDADLEDRLKNLCENEYAKEYLFFLLLQKKEEWKLTNTPQLFKEFLTNTSWQPISDDDLYSGLDPSFTPYFIYLIEICLSILFQSDISSENDAAIHLLCGEAADNDYTKNLAELTKEVKEFLRNNPWFKKEIENYMSAAINDHKRQAEHIESRLSEFSKI